jgi:hypothetical protein
MIGEPAVAFATPLPRSVLVAMVRGAQAPRCALPPESPRGAPDWVDQDERFWTESLDRLADHLADLNEEDDTSDDDTTDNQ